MSAYQVIISEVKVIDEAVRRSYKNPVALFISGSIRYYIHGKEIPLHQFKMRVKRMMPIVTMSA